MNILIFYEKSKKNSKNFQRISHLVLEIINLYLQVTKRIKDKISI